MLEMLIKAPALADPENAAATMAATLFRHDQPLPRTRQLFARFRQIACFALCLAN